MTKSEAEQTLRTTVTKAIIDEIKESIESGDKRQLEKDIVDLERHTAEIVMAARTLDRMVRWGRSKSVDTTV